MAITVVTGSKPDLLTDLSKTWRSSPEHRTAQVKLFASTLLGLVVLQALGDLSTGKSLAHLTDPRALWTYLLPLVLVAWRQVYPALTAAEADSAPGMTIVPEQVAPQVVPAIPDPGIPAPADVVQTDNRPRPGVDPDITRNQNASVYVGMDDDQFDPDADPIVPPTDMGTDDGTS